jgi:hypothetical protein
MTREMRYSAPEVWAEMYGKIASPLVKTLHQLASSQDGIAWADAPRYSGVINRLELNFGTETLYVPSRPFADSSRTILIEEATFPFRDCIAVKGSDRIFFVASFIFRSLTFFLTFDNSSLIYGETVRVPSPAVTLFGPYAEEEADAAAGRIVKRMQS